MIPAHSYTDICEVLTQAFIQHDQRRGEHVRLTGVLFARPTSQLTTTEILPNLPYFHIKSGKNFHLFCAGYGAYWPSAWVPDKKSDGSAGDIPWEFSEHYFIDLVNQIKKEISLRTKRRWRYSGGVD